MYLRICCTNDLLASRFTILGNILILVSIILINEIYFVCIVELWLSITLLTNQIIQLSFSRFFFFLQKKIWSIVHILERVITSLHYYTVLAGMLPLCVSVCKIITTCFQRKDSKNFHKIANPSYLFEWQYCIASTQKIFHDVKRKYVVLSVEKMCK